MSIATDKARLDAAKADLKTFLEDNSVTVPAGTKIDGMVELLADIETGGGVETATITITGEETTRIMYVDENGLLQYASCSPGTILQSIVGSVIVLNWDVYAIRKQVTGLNMRLILRTSHVDSWILEI